MDIEFPNDKPPTENEGLSFNQYIALKIIKIINFSLVHTWHDSSFYLNCLTVMEKGYDLSDYQIKRIDNAFNLLVANSGIELPETPPLKPLINSTENDDDAFAAFFPDARKMKKVYES